jgi:hypothetical protein
MKFNIQSMKTGFARLHNIEGGAVSVYVDKEIGRILTLPSKTRLKAIWDEDTKELIIKEWTD